MRQVRKNKKKISKSNPEYMQGLKYSGQAQRHKGTKAQSAEEFKKIPLRNGKEESDFNIAIVVKRLRKHTELEKAPVVTYVANLTNDPYRILISCILSLRTKDKTTTEAAQRLFAAAQTPEQMLKLSHAEIARLIYPVGFYNVKAHNILEISRVLQQKFNGEVPAEMDTLLALPGVGRKTANLVITEAFGKYGICVDTHVHRIMNRLGYVRTETAHETEFALRKKLPKKYWIEINTLLVKFGQIICVPVSPFCGKCNIAKYCKRIGVLKHR